MTSPIRPIMSCERFTDALADLLEREAPESARADLEAHALSCASCGPLLADLRRLRADAANLPELAPSRDLWSGIAARIETPVVAIGTPASPRLAGAARRRTALWMGLAAAGLVAATAGVTYQITRQSIARAVGAVGAVAAATPIEPPLAALTPAAADTTAAPVGAAAAKASAANLASGGSAVRQTPAPARTGSPAAAVSLASNPSDKLTPAQTYDAEIGRLRRIVDRRRGSLDSTTVAVLEKNLRIIDDAIAQCRGALQKDPSSSYLNNSLTDALDDKVQLLRAVATLPAAL